MRYPPPPLKDEEDEEKPGDTFEGTMEHGKRAGRGLYKWGASGAEFDGEYVAGQKHGKGKMTFPDKSTYEGESSGLVVGRSLTGRTWEVVLMGEGGGGEDAGPTCGGRMIVQQGWAVFRGLGARRACALPCSRH